MLILGIESSCDETAAAVVRDDGFVLSNIVASQIELFESLGGVVPEIAARAHTEKILVVIDAAIKQAKVDWAQIDRMAVTQGPGLIGSLLIGQSTAHALAFAKGKPLVRVDHLRAHLLAAFLQRQKAKGERQKEENLFPAIGLLVSGGHTELVFMQDIDSWQIVGHTIDDAAGEAFDKVGKLLGLPYPGGPHVSKRAEQGDPQAFDFPRSYLEKGSLDFSFSGLKTAVLREVKRERQEARYTDIEKFVADVASSFQQAVVDVLVDKTEMAVDSLSTDCADYAENDSHANSTKGTNLFGNSKSRDTSRRVSMSIEMENGEAEIKSVFLAGGVAANGALRAAMRERFGNRLHIPDLQFCTDNAAMVAYAGSLTNNTNNV